MVPSVQQNYATVITNLREKLTDEERDEIIKKQILMEMDKSTMKNLY